MSIYWAFGSIEKILNQAFSADLTLQLGEEEQKFLELLRFKKRREEWLAGRLALKKILQAVVPDLSVVETRRIQIIKAENGAPILQVDSVVPAPLAISLSHSNGFVLCAVTSQTPKLGVDLEMIEARSDSFIQDYFTVKEVAEIDHHSSEDRAFLSTLLWSEKEAVLKALAVGLKVDTRRIEVDVAGHLMTDDWQTSAVAYEQENSLRLLWRRQDHFVFSLCGEFISPSDLIQVSL